MFSMGQKVKMTRNALDNYGKEYDGVVFEVIHVATMYMKAWEIRWYSKLDSQGADNKKEQ